MKINKEQILKKLKAEGYDESVIQRLLKHFPDEIDNRLKNSYEAYIKTGEFKDFEYDDVSLSLIMQKRNSHYFQALRDMNKLLLKYEKNREEYNKWKRIITTPVHYE